MISKKALLLAAALLGLTSVLQAASDVSVSKGLSKGGKFKGKNPKVFTPTKPKAIASKATVQSVLNLGKGVTINTAGAATAEGDLVFGAAITKTKGKDATLTLNAVRDLSVKASIGVTKGKLPLVLKAGRGISSTAAVSTSGGDVTINTVEPFVLGEKLAAGAGRVLLQTGSLHSTKPVEVVASVVEVSQGAFWRQQGTLAGNLSVAGSIAAGPQGASSLQVGGGVALQPGATLVVNLGGTAPGSFGAINATGAVALNGTLQLDCINGFEDLIVGGHSFTIISGDSITGTFTGLENGSRIFLPDELGSLKVTYNAKSVVLSDWQPILIDQTWDPGDLDNGTFVYTNARIRGKRHYFRVHTQETDIGAWRSRVTPAQGEADLYLLKGNLPARNAYFKASEHVGEDGFVLNENEFDAGEEWFLLVYADPGTPWTFFTGRAFVYDMGTLQWTDADSSGTYNIGESTTPSVSGNLEFRGEGMRFFKATLPVGTAAWSLWLSGSSKDIAVRKSVVPFHGSTLLYDRKQSGQMLVVPPYLGSGQATYFASVVGRPGEAVNLDSRIQEVTDIQFDSTVGNVSVPDAPYRVYRVQVPVDEIAWDVSVLPIAGDPNVAVRRDTVPAEFDNDAFSEVPGLVSDSITLVPQFLTDGTWFITVYGKSEYRFTLRNGPPVVTPLQFTDTKINDQPNRVGWRFYALTDIPNQLGALGWALDLAQHVPGTEVAIRRNAVPSRWRSRKNGKPAVTVSNTFDFSGIGGLQRPGHQADIWYVGVYMPIQELGAFQLSCHPIQPPTINFDGGTATITNLQPGMLSYVRIDVPAGVTGWDVRVREAIGGNPGLAIRRDQLPALESGVLANLGAWTPSRSTTWPTGNQWVGGLDWTGYALNGPSQPPGNRLVMGTGMPLEPGTYYVGVYNGSTVPITSCTLDSFGVGSGQTYPVTSVAYSGGTATISNLAPREARYFKVSVPPGSPSWELLLDTNAGEAEMVIRRGTIPDFAAAGNGEIYGVTREVEMKKVGPERYVMFPLSGSSLIPEGDYYIAVVSEGTAPSGSTIGTGTSSAALRSLGALPVKHLGTASETVIQEPVNLVAGQVVAYQFDGPENAYSLEVRLDDREDPSAMTITYGTEQPKAATAYGSDGGVIVDPVPLGDADALIYTLIRPPAGRYSITINAGTTAGARGNLKIKTLPIVPVGFDGGKVQVTGHEPGTLRYFVVDVPAGASGWDVRMTNLTGPMQEMSVCRGFLTAAPGQTTAGWRYWMATAWPEGNQSEAGVDWTGYTNGNSVPPRLVTATGRPLEPGKYYIGVLNPSTTTPASYTIDSRGIGDGLTYPIANLDFASGDADINNLAPREARYFKVNIPAGTASWEVTLATTEGELELLARQGAIPDFRAERGGSIYRQNFGCEVEMQKLSNERFALFPPMGADLIPPGDYYLAVVSEGVGPSGSSIGSGTSSGVLKSRPFTHKDLGAANATGTVEPVDLVGGQVKAYSFTVPAGTDSLEVSLNNIVGNFWVSLGNGTRYPSAPGETFPNIELQVGQPPFNEYGADGGNGGAQSNKIITFVNPPPGECRVVVRAGHDSVTPTIYNNASANLVITALTTVPLNYDGGTFTVNEQPFGTWRYFRVEVPPGVAGWDIRLRDLVGPVPTMVVRRGLLPIDDPTSWNPWTATSWPLGNYWFGRVDWTNYQLDADGDSVPPRLVAGMGRPLEPGTYYIGVTNKNAASEPSYTIESRGIGDGRIFPVTTLDFAGGSAAITNLAPREAQYFKVTIPPNTPSWEVTLASTLGDVELLARAGAIPDFHALREGNVYAGSREVEMQKAGPERYVLLPNGVAALPEGDYYLAVVSEGVNAGSNKVGTGSSSGLVTSVGALPITNLGTVTEGGVGGTVTLAGGQIKVYQFSVAPGTDSMELRLSNTVGYPAVSLIPGTIFPVPPGYDPLGAFPHSEYGFDGGFGGTQTDDSYTITTPVPGLWTLLVRARHDPDTSKPTGVFYPEAQADLQIRTKPNIPLNFAEVLNGSGGTHTDTRQAIDGEYNVYEVTVPPTLAGEAVLGWMIRTEVFQGAVALEVYKDPANPTGGITLPIGTAVVVPPFLTFNETWYVRVKATGLTNYKITSTPVKLERPAWQMPKPHNQVFGDSGTDISGNPLPGDRGVDLEQGSWHFYAIDVPADNLGLLRTELQAISGNPDLYIREDGVPTIHHKRNGRTGTTLAPRMLTGTTTSYGNWVPVDGKTATALRPGRWYLGVRAGGNSNVRYRLINSTGNVIPMALNAATGTPQVPNSITEHSLADNDWRYYRFTIPENAPSSWTVSFTRQLGEVVMWMRDTVPPGQTDLNTNFGVNIADWATDVKNQGPYATNMTQVGPHTFATPPLRPGHTYYVGIRSNNSATFSLSSTTDGPAVDHGPDLDFYNGSVTTTIPAGGSVRYRVVVPPEGTQFKYSATNASTVRIRIEQGTLAATSGSQHFVSGGANAALSQDLEARQWPWLPDKAYYIRVVNTSAAEQPFTFTLNGKNALTEDEDFPPDGLPDAWEVQYFGNITSQNGTGDPDGDGVNNLTEYTDGTVPNDANSAKYVLTLQARNGVASVTPNQVKYDRGTFVSLSNTPSDGNTFVGWSGGPLRADNFALRATGTITIPTSGIWTFGVNAADGSRLIVNGTQVILDNTFHDVTDKFGQINLGAGTYPVEIVAFERRGGEGLELFAAPGTHSAFNTDFRLVGDVANGGLAVSTLVNSVSTPGFTVRQVESRTAVIDDLGDADGLLSGTIPARQDVTGVIDVVNFLTYDLSEGHFDDNAHFPITAAIEDNPLSIAMNGNYTMTALNTIPLGTAADAESVTWLTGSNAPWIGANDPNSADGVDSVSSGPVGDNESSYLQAIVTGPATVSFKWRISSQQAGDTLNFMTNGVQRAAISGEAAWTNSQTYTLPAGVNVLTWHYTKNATLSSGTDRAWVDQVVITP